MLKVWSFVLYMWKRHSHLKNVAWNVLWWLRTLKSTEAGYTVRVAFQKLHFGAVLADWVSGPLQNRKNKIYVHNPLTLFYFKAWTSLSRESLHVVHDMHCYRRETFVKVHAEFFRNKYRFLNKYLYNTLPYSHSLQTISPKGNDRLSESNVPISNLIKKNI